MNTEIKGLTNLQQVSLTILRVLIGWHFLYEGLVKVLNPTWSAYGFLNSSKWIFSDLFMAIASDEALLKVTDLINAWGLVLIGLFLMIGFLTRISAILGALLLLLYYVAMPPLLGIEYSMPMEGSYMIVNKTLIEASALLVVGLLSNNGTLRLNILIGKVQTKFTYN